MQADYADYAECAEYADLFTADGAYLCPVGSVWLFLLNIDSLLGLAESFSHVILAVINAQIMSRDSDPYM